MMPVRNIFEGQSATLGVDNFQLALKPRSLVDSSVVNSILIASTLNMADALRTGAVSEVRGPLYADTNCVESQLVSEHA